MKETRTPPDYIGYRLSIPVQSGETISDDAISKPKVETERMSDEERIVHLGGCHCGALRFQVEAPASLHIYRCNCSICHKKQNHHFIVPGSRFKLLQGADNISTYTFNTHQAKHTFCKTCGVQCFYTPRSNPDGYGVTPHSLDPGTVANLEYEDFDGQNWESHITSTDIQERSKE